MSDVLTAAQRRYCMSRIRGKNTKPEILLRKELWALGFRYRIKNKLPGHPDVVFPRKRVAVFIDGCFWHCCPKHCKMPETNRDFWEKKLHRNVERDKEVTRKLKKDGWKVIRFWEHQIKSDLISCVNRIVRYLNNQK